MASAVKAPAAASDEARRLVAHWAAQPDDRLAHLVRDVTRAFARALSVRLAARGVSFGHWTFLRVLWERDGLTQRELSLEAGVMEPTTAAAVRRMEALGYVARRKRAGNRKNVHIHLTPRGRALERRLVPLAVEVNALAVEGIAPGEVAVVRRALVAMLANLARER